MPTTSKPSLPEKENLHPRSAHRKGYDFDALIKSTPQLRPFVKLNEYGISSINYSDPEAVKMLNKSLLKQFYNINDWDIPEGYLCPPIPGRADYIHYIADLLAEANGGTIPTGKKIKLLDIGTGANCIYPLIGNSVYNWLFVGTDIDPLALGAAKKTLMANPQLKGNIKLRQQNYKHHIFEEVIADGEGFDATICNPPFHASAQEARLATIDKWNKLQGTGKPALNFGGQKKELWYHGGEAAFIRLMIEESVPLAQQCLWFTTLVSKKDTLPGVYRDLKKAKVVDTRTINMSQGQKTSRIVAWTFFNEAERTEWATRWWNKDEKPAPVKK